MSLTLPAVTTPVRVTAGAASREFEAWTKTLPKGRKSDFPDPRTPGGLPTGWHVRASCEPKSAIVDCLVSRDAGGWMLVEHIHSDMRTVPDYTLRREFETTLVALYEKVCYAVDGFSSDGTEWHTVEEMMRGFICLTYNPTDPVEAAEQVLVALGNRPTVIPAALLT